jgi:hypothetical protein
MPVFCVPTLKPVRNDVSEIYYNSDSLLKKEVLLDENMSKRDILIANASGSLDVLHEMESLLRDSIRQKKAYLEYSTEIDKNLMLVGAEMDAVSSELDCEISRCRQLASYLAGINNKKNSNLTVAAIVTGSVTTIAPIFITQKPAQNIVLISGGTIAAVLGLLTLHPGGKEIKLTVTNNLLTDIWYESKTSAVYPASVWYIQGEPHFTNLEMVSKATLIKSRWLEYELNGVPDKHTVQMLFGDGGLFDQGGLEVRASMLSEVMSHVYSLKKDLDNFSYDLSKLKLRILNRWE